MEMDRRTALKLLTLASAELVLNACGAPKVPNAPLTSDEDRVLKEMEALYRESPSYDPGASAILVLASIVSNRPPEEIVKLYKEASPYTGQPSAMLVLGAVMSGQSIDKMNSLYDKSSIKNPLACATIAAATAIKMHQSPIN